MIHSSFEKSLESIDWKAALGSQSAVKKAALAPFASEVLCFSVDSQVPAQPIGESQTRQGAQSRSRAAYACAQSEAVEFGVGLEGGVLIEEDRCFLINWGALYAPWLKDCIIESCGPRLELPQQLIEPLQNGEELRDVIASFKKKVPPDLDPLSASAMSLFSMGAFRREEMFEVICRSLLGQYLLRKNYAILFEK